VLIELIIAAFVAAYVTVVAFGHVLLVVAVYRGPREDSSGGRGRRTAVRPRIAVSTPMNRKHNQAIFAGSVADEMPRRRIYKVGKRRSLISASCST
jgi:hypothetical protein